MRRASLDDHLAAFVDSALAGEPDLPADCALFVRSGKRLRAKLLLASADRGRPNADADLMRAAAAIEFVHAASLLHDDIVDECDERRGKPAFHRTHGIEAATLAGTHLVHVALSLIADLPPIARARMADVAREVARGQLLELMSAGDATTSAEDRLATMQLKTASVFGLACELGGRLTGAEETESLRRRRFGQAFGMLFQVADDVEDLFASASEQGRRPATDLQRAVMSLPIVFALRTSARRRVMELLAPSAIRTEGATVSCRELVRSSGALARTIDVATEFAVEASDHLETLPPTAGTRWMATLVDSTTARITRFGREVGGE